MATSGPQSVGARPVSIAGRRTGNTVDFTVHTDHDGDTRVIGTIQGDTVGGSYIDNESQPGTFTGGTC